MRKLSVIPVLLLTASACLAQPSTVLWTIGKADHNDSEFALAPDGFSRFASDGFFVVDQSDAKRDWPYVHPGPADGWAGGRPHTFTIVFGLKTPPGAGQCRLELDLVDTHAAAPPSLRIDVNGQTFERPLAAGAGDESVHGQPAKGKPQKVAVEFPANLLGPGDNAIELTTVRGSWLLYDSLALRVPAGAELGPVQERTVVQQVQPVRALQEKAGGFFQPVRVSLRHFGDDAQARLRVEGATPLAIQLTNGLQTFEVLAPAADRQAECQIAVEVNGRPLASRRIVLNPVRKLVIYVLPHSHTDIGYTEIQTAIEKKQVNNLLQGIEAARKTANYPQGARFVWNVEVLWAADLYLRRLGEAQRADFFEAVKRGQVALNGMYLNELTGLCRPEELLRLFRFSTELAARCGVAIDSAMISDVPGYTWGTVTAMAQAGIKYFSVAPNYIDRIGNILVEWENKPFYWVSPSGNEKVLVWIPFKGYALSHIYGKLSPEFAAEYQGLLDQQKYPYEISYLRWSGHGDNAVPDPAICEFIRDWNAKYTYPKLIISSTSEAFRAFEKRYGDRIPKVRGDWTPYWEDGAGSSALETGMNRASSDRLAQAETLWAMLDPAHYPASAFQEAWRNLLLYSEHTWGADGSVSDPENKKTKEQWAIKRSYALEADAQSRQLLERACLSHSSRQSASPPGSGLASSIDVFNTTSWPRTDLVVLSKERSASGDRVVAGRGRVLPSQRLSNGELAFVAQDVPPFGGRRYTLAPEPSGARSASLSQPCRIEGACLDNGLLRVRLDETTGDIKELRAKGIDANLVDTASGHALNQYLFLESDNLAHLKTSGRARFKIGERGPLVASLLIESDAPGSRRLTREVRLLAGADWVELIDTVDKERAPISPKPGDWQFALTGGKESVNFAFAFNVPNGQVQIDLPLAAMRPEADQLVGSCKNWFTVGRWCDVANRDYGVAWVTLDAPLVQVGGITANLLGSQTNPTVWRKKVEPTQKLYSWAMNNHWETNYRAYQDGPVSFRYVLRPHRATAPDQHTRFAIALSQPLLTAPASDAALAPSRLLVQPEAVTVLAMKPSDDGKAIIVRLFGGSGKAQHARLTWSKPPPRQLWLSDTSERPVEKLKGPVAVPAWSVVTLRADLPH